MLQGMDQGNAHAAQSHRGASGVNPARRRRMLTPKPRPLRASCCAQTVRSEY
jgi:hypothetical protein